MNNAKKDTCRQQNRDLRRKTRLKLVIGNLRHEHIIAVINKTEKEVSPHTCFAQKGFELTYKLL